MSNIFTVAESGALKAKSRYPRRPFRYADSITFGKCYPVLVDFMMAGDVYKISYDMLVRLMPMKAPLLNNINARIRFGYVPLRLIESNAEFVITGSKDGKFDASVTVPDLQNVWQWVKDCRSAHSLSTTDNTVFYVDKDSLLHKLGMDTGTYKYGNVKNNKSALAAWVVKAYCRFWWDYYRDENLFVGIPVNGSIVSNSNSDFDIFVRAVGASLLSTTNGVGSLPPFFVFRKKDYLTSALPWQLKGVAPRIDLDIGFSGAITNTAGSDDQSMFINLGTGANTVTINSGYSSAQTANANANFNKFMNAGLSAGTAGVTAEQIREVMAETRIMERLARTGSRYTEYLRANFGISPADGTLQRSQYLGGGKMPVIISEVLQTAGAENESQQQLPVGTMRGHGITRGGNSVTTFVSYEFGVLVAFVDLMPQTIYSQGVSRRLTYTNRWDFFNPSFQHLSEQTIRKGEVMYRNVADNNTDSAGNIDNNDTDWGFTGIYNELRVGETKVRGDLIDNLSYWSQAIKWISFPELNEAFIRFQPADYTRPFAVTDESLAKPAILDIVVNCDSYRPMIKFATPGLNDHF